MYYAHDANFLDYFGAVAGRAGHRHLHVVTNVSSYSKDLTEFPLKPLVKIILPRLCL